MNDFKSSVEVRKMGNTDMNVLIITDENGEVRNAVKGVKDEDVAELRRILLKCYSQPYEIRIV